LEIRGNWIWIGIVDLKRLLLTSSLAGLAMGVLTVVPIVSLCNLLFCGWIWAGAIFSAWHYDYLGSGVKDEDGTLLPERRITNAEGATVGTLSGMLAASVASLLYYFYYASIGMDEWTQAAAGIFGIPPGVIRESIPNLGFSEVMNLSAYQFILFLFIFSAIGSFGGLLGAMWVRRRKAVTQRLDRFD
jgi:hypothetical protein